MQLSLPEKGTEKFRMESVHDLSFLSIAWFRSPD